MRSAPSEQSHLTLCEYPLSGDVALERFLEVALFSEQLYNSDITILSMHSSFIEQSSPFTFIFTFNSLSLSKFRIKPFQHGTDPPSAVMCQMTSKEDEVDFRVFRDEVFEQLTTESVLQSESRILHSNWLPITRS